MSWTASTEKTMPVDTGAKLVYCPAIKQTLMAWWNPTVRAWVYYGPGGRVHSAVSHWRDLPPIPEPTTEASP